MSLDPKSLFLLGMYVVLILFFGIAALIARASVRGRHRRASAHR